MAPAPSCPTALTRSPLSTSYRFWSSAAFLIHISFSFFSMLFQVISMAFKAFSRSFWGQTGVSAVGRVTQGWSGSAWAVAEQPLCYEINNKATAYQEKKEKEKENGKRKQESNNNHHTHTHTPQKKEKEKREKKKPRTTPFPLPATLKRAR